MLRRDKGRGMVIIDRKKYNEKCMDMLITRQFRKLDNDSTKTLKQKFKELPEKLKVIYPHLIIEHSILADQHKANVMELPRNIKSQ